jgi:hypothetical protein
MFQGMPRDFHKFDDLWASKRFDDLCLLLINWALGRTVSFMDEGFHVEKRPDCSEKRRKPAGSPPYPAPYPPPYPVPHSAMPLRI